MTWLIFMSQEFAGLTVIWLNLYHRISQLASVIVQTSVWLSCLCDCPASVWLSCLCVIVQDSVWLSRPLCACPGLCVIVQASVWLSRPMCDCPGLCVIVNISVWLSCLLTTSGGLCGFVTTETWFCYNFDRWFVSWFGTLWMVVTCHTSCVKYDMLYISCEMWHIKIHVWNVTCHTSLVKCDILHRN